jgi:hypothetical protein
MARLWGCSPFADQLEATDALGSTVLESRVFCGIGMNGGATCSGLGAYLNEVMATSDIRRVSRP